MAQGRQKNAGGLEDLETQVREARHLVQQSKLKVEAIEASIYEIEKFQPKIKFINRPARRDPAPEDAVGLIADYMVLKAA